MEFEYEVNRIEKTKFLFTHSLFQFLNSLSDRYSSVICMVDVEVYRMYQPQWNEMKNVKVLSGGEKAKDFNKLIEYYKFLIDREVDKDAIIVGIGGGVVSDLVGFVASSYKRGVAFGLIPSTILSAVDAAIGGKNGVNFLGYKNMIGLITQPHFLAYNSELLAQLPRDIFMQGFAEVIKYALISDIDMLKELQNYHSNVTNISDPKCQLILQKCAEIKMRFVSSDPYEKGLRKILNFGHTLGHALESQLELNHGHSVAIGMSYSGYVSMSLGKITLEEYLSILNLISLYELPVNCDINPPLLTKKILQDKKRKGDQLDFIILEKLGSAGIYSMKLGQICQYIEEWQLWMNSNREVQQIKKH